MTPDSPFVAELRPSPNHNARRGEGAPDILLLHYTGMGTGAGALSWLCDRRQRGLLPLSRP